MAVALATVCIVFGIVFGSNSWISEHEIFGLCLLRMLCYRAVGSSRKLSCSCFFSRASSGSDLRYLIFS